MLPSRTVDDVLNLARCILTSPATAEVAQTLLEPVASAIGADMAAFREIDVRLGAPRIGHHASAGVPSGLHDQYVETFYKLDPAIDPGLAHSEDGVMGCLTSVSRMDATTPVAWMSEANKRYLDDFLIPNQLLNNISLHVHAREHGKLFLMDFHRASANSVFSNVDMAIAQMVCPAIQLFCLRLLDAAPGSAPETGHRLFRLGGLPLSDSPAGGAQSRHLHANLTERERDVALAILKGLSDKEVARHLGISLRTVQNHLRNIYWKNQVHSRSQLISKLIGAR